MNDDVSSLSCPSKLLSEIFAFSFQTVQNVIPKNAQFHARNNYSFQRFEEEVGKKKNIDQLNSTKSFPPFDYERSSSLKYLSDSIHFAGNALKRIQMWHGM